jgi:hypothetical protein
MEGSMIATKFCEYVRLWRISVLLIPFLFFSGVVFGDGSGCAPVNLTSVKYLGKFDKPGLGSIDRVQINWTLGASPCAFIQGTFSMRIVLHRPSGTDRNDEVTINVAPTAGTGIAEVPRGTLERNPENYDLFIKYVVNAQAGNGRRISGTGQPQFAGAQITEIFPLNAGGEPIIPDPVCKAALNITGLTYTNPTTGPETLTLAYTVAQPQNSCIKIQNFQTKAVITRRTGGQSVVPPFTSGPLTSQAAGSDTFQFALPFAQDEVITAWSADLLFLSHVLPTNPENALVQRIRFSFN